MVGILPTPRVIGMSSLDLQEEDRKPLMLDRMTITEALTTVFDTDAHFVSYFAVDDDGDNCTYSRCNKPILSELRDIGHDLFMQTIGIDWDTPDPHDPWTPDLLKEREAILEFLMETNPIMKNMFASYRTQKGYRFIFALENRVPVDEGERYISGVLKELKSLGIVADALSDWTRLFRLPYVVRDSKNTWEEWSFDIHLYKNILPNDLITPCDRGELLVSKAETVSLNTPYPTDDEASDLKEIRDLGGRYRSTEVFKDIRKRLKGHRCFSCAFENQPMAEEGARNQTMMSYIGEAILECIDIKGIKPEHIYALYLDAVLNFEADQDWRRTLWTGIINIWNKEQGILVNKHRAKLERQIMKDEGMRSVIKGMMEWDVSEELRDSEIAENYARRQMIANVGKNYFLIGIEGSYSPMPLSKEQLIPAIRHSDVAELILTKYMNTKNQLVDMPINRLINEYTLPVREIERIPQVDMNGFIRQRKSNHPVLVLPLYRRNPMLTPTYDEAVDNWLKSFFGKWYDIMCKWIAYALAFEEGPICGLSIKGAQGVGKNMFVQGLSECLEHPFTATASDLTSAFQSGMLRSPFLWVDEGWPKNNFGMSPSDQFRKLTSGGAITINDKYMPLQKIYNPMRAIFTANNDNVVQELSDGRDLSPGDREAIAIRLLHYDVGCNASEYLKERGGRKLTSCAGQKWIADEGGDTDYLVAKHFLWLHSKRHDWARGDRFLVEGNIENLSEDHLMFDMLTRNGKTPLIIETILKLYEHFDSRTGIVMEDGKLFVMISEIVNYIRDNHYSEGRVRSSEVADSLKNLVVDAPYPRTLKSRKSQGEREWYELDSKILLRAAKKFGYPMSKLIEHSEEAV